MFYQRMETWPSDSGEKYSWHIHGTDQIFGDLAVGWKWEEVEDGLGQCRPIEASRGNDAWVNMCHPP